MNEPDLNLAVLRISFVFIKQIVDDVIFSELNLLTEFGLRLFRYSLNGFSQFYIDSKQFFSDHILLILFIFESLYWFDWVSFQLVVGLIVNVFINFFWYFK